MSNAFFGLLGIIIGGVIGWFFGRKNIIFQEYRNIVTEFNDILIGILNSIDGLDSDKNTEAARFVNENFIKTDLLFKKLISRTRSSSRKRKINEAYYNYKKPYIMSPEEIDPFNKFPGKTIKYSIHYRPKDIQDGINVAKKNIEHLIDIIDCHSIFSLFCCFKEKHNHLMETTR